MPLLSIPPLATTLPLAAPGLPYPDSPWLVGLHSLSDILIGLCHTAIAATLVWLVYRSHRAIPFSWMFLAFGAFIVACGVGHFMHVLTVWNHDYWWLLAAAQAATVVASLFSAALLPPPGLQPNGPPTAPVFTQSRPESVWVGQGVPWRTISVG